MSLSFKVFDPATGAVYTGVGYNLVFYEVDVLEDGHTRQLDLSKVVVLKETPIRLPDNRPLYEGDVFSVLLAGEERHYVASLLSAVEILYYDNPFHHKVDAFKVHGNEYVTPGLYEQVKAGVDNE